jgi:molybdopterin molybdotransferase
MNTLLPLEDALARMVDALAPLQAIALPLIEADGCVLAEPCISSRTQPPFDVSAMDGYALPVSAAPGQTYQVIGEVPAGEQFDRQINPGQTVRIFTGAPVPAGAVHVVMQEDVERGGDTITISERAGKGANIRPKGGDFSSGDVLIEAGTRLTPQHIALAASGNHEQLTVHPRPKIAILMNGDELVLPGTDAPGDAIIASNGYGLAALVKRMRGEVVMLDLAADTMDAIAGSIARAHEKNADVLVTIGGSSVGDYDLIRPALIEAGYTLDFPKVALRPGKPTVFGHKPGCCVLGLPGNPVSSMVSAVIFLPPLIGKLSGHPNSALLSTQTATLGADLPANGPRAHFMRAVRGKDGRYAPVSSQDSSLLKLLAGADALIQHQAGDGARQAGENCQILPLPR